MRWTMLSAGAVGTFMLAWALLSARVVSSDQRDDIKVSYSATSPTFSLHEPVLVELRIRNDGIRTVIANLGAEYKSSFRMTVTTPDGRRTGPLLWEHQWGFAVSGRIHIGRGEEQARRLLMNEWYSFNEPGVYQLEFDILDAFSTEDGTPVDAVVRGGLKVEVATRDEGRLRAACRSFAADAENAVAAQTRLDAARAMTFMTDPVAVPCVRSVLSHTTWVDAVLIPGLAKIQTDEAHRLLEELVREGGDRGDLAMGALATGWPSNAAHR
jgi:hypothetical protein